jgi:nucleoside-diphosphate-sugar epimerase
MRILLIGGSKFMGLFFIQKIIEYNTKSSTQIELYIINRGNIYWNGAFYNMIENKDYIHHYKADRKNVEEFTNCINTIKNDIINTTNNINTTEITTTNTNNNEDFITFNYVVDFTCYKCKELKILLDALNLSFHTFIFISTDSTYNASEISLKKNAEFFLNKDDDKNVIEEDALLITEPGDLKSKLKQRDSYGYHKLKCESYLKTRIQNKNYFILRLPDVIGSYDETYRIWNYIYWIKYSNIKPIEFEPVDLVRKLSFVTKEDVIDILFDIILNNCSERINNEYNISSFNELTLKNLVDYIADKINVSNYQYKIVDYSAHTYLPSVTFGPISSDKAKSQLNFNPIKEKFFDSLNETINFFISAENLYKKEYLEMIENLPNEIKKKLN